MCIRMASLSSTAIAAYSRRINEASGKRRAAILRLTWHYSDIYARALSSREPCDNHHLHSAAPCNLAYPSSLPSRPPHRFPIFIFCVRCVGIRHNQPAAAAHMRVWVDKCVWRLERKLNKSRAQEKMSNFTFLTSSFGTPIFSTSFSLPHLLRLLLTQPYTSLSVNGVCGMKAAKKKRSKKKANAMVEISESRGCGGGRKVLETMALVHICWGFYIFNLVDLFFSGALSFPSLSCAKLPCQTI